MDWVILGLMLVGAAIYVVCDLCDFQNLPPIFEFHATSGDVFIVNVDGTHEGFGTGYVINRIPQHLARVSELHPGWNGRTSPDRYQTKFTK